MKELEPSTQEPWLCTVPINFPGAEDQPLAHVGRLSTTVPSQTVAQPLSLGPWKSNFNF